MRARVEGYVEIEEDWRMGREPVGKKVGCELMTRS
jgi:hypothetical protein